MASNPKNTICVANGESTLSYTDDECMGALAIEDSPESSTGQAAAVDVTLSMAKARDVDTETVAAMTVAEAIRTRTISLMREALNLVIQSVRAASQVRAESTGTSQPQVMKRSVPMDAPETESQQIFRVQASLATERQEIRQGVTSIGTTTNTSAYGIEPVDAKLTRWLAQLGLHPT